jgi:hypothetical protein
MVGDMETALNRVRSRAGQWELHGWTLIDSSENPPKITLEKTVTVLESGSCENGDFQRDRHCRSIWIDEHGELKDEETSCP